VSAMRITGATRHAAQVERCAREAAARLRVPVSDGLRIHVATVRHTVVVRGQYCAPTPRSRVIARGWVNGFGRINSIAVVRHPDGTIPDMTVRWETGRVLLWHAGVRDPAEQERRMNAKGFRSWR
jgi:hypothetical protein